MSGNRCLECGSTDIHETYLFPRENLDDLSCECLECGKEWSAIAIRLILNEEKYMSNKVSIKMGKEFSALLVKYLGIEIVREIVEKNKEDVGDWCSSHEYCDANMVMAEAFNKACGRELEMNSEEDCLKWNEAWDYAKANSFFI